MNFLRKISASLILALAVTGAHATDGNELLDGYRQYKKADTDSAIASGYYFKGFVWGVTVGFANLSDRLCLPDNVTDEQIFDIVGTYVNDHPEERHKSASLLIMRALKNIFPCAQANPSSK